MKNSDILLYPSISETFGFLLLESMSFGMPVVTIKTDWTPSIEEIIIDGKTGYVEKLKKIPSLRKIGDYERSIIEKLFKSCSKLIENPALRERMSKECLKEISQGKFSIKERNKKLAKIYGEALK